MGQTKRGLASWASLSIVVFCGVMVLGQKAVLRDPMAVDQKCEVSEKIPCAETTISQTDCDALNCCFDGQQCYYGNAVTVQCTLDGHFVVVVSKYATVPELALDSLSLREGSEEPCSPVGVTADFVVFYVPVNACGTIMKEEDGYMVYENRLSSTYEVETGSLGFITRDGVFELLFKCWYWGSAVVPMMADVYTLVPPPPVVVPGPLRVELRLANGRCYTKGCVEADHAYSSYYVETDYPVTKVLRQPVYVEVRVLERTDPSLVLLLENCWATSTPSPVSLPQWKLLVNGCPYQDDQYLTTLVPVDHSSGLPFPAHYKRFIFKMFSFVNAASMIPLKEQVFIHCSTAVCSPSATDSCEQRCFRQRRDVGAVQKNSSHKVVVVSSGELVLTSLELPASDMQRSPREVPQSLSYGLLGVVASVVFGVFALVLAIAWRSRRRLAMK